MFRAPSVSMPSVCEFGVASGDGLVNLADLAELVTSETGVAIRVLGFDDGDGVPARPDLVGGWLRCRRKVV